MRSLDDVQVFALALRSNRFSVFSKRILSTFRALAVIFENNYRAVECFEAVRANPQLLLPKRSCFPL